ncbi:MAG: DUF1016 N-terminal domain-containing protein [Candidatus Paracaedibacter sp.]
MNKELIDQNLLNDIRSLVNETKSLVARALNQNLTLLYWHIGKRIQDEILKFERAEYGEKIIENLASYLSVEYSKGFSKRNVSYMVQFYMAFPKYEILQTASAKLSWSHFLALISAKEQQAIEFYTYACSNENWSVRQLRSNVV